MNTIPSARMSQAGTMQFSVSRQSPYTHSALGFQLSDRLYVGLRQTAEAKSFTSDATHLYPGMDAKLSLFGERRFLPQIAAGLQSAFGHKRMAAEYLAMSKRVDNFDFTFGFGWGRLATRNGLFNPILINHLSKNKDRATDGESPARPQDWFTGNMGLFGGFEYHLPVDGLSFKADWNSDGWAAEKAADPNFKAPAPWSVGLSYKPFDWMDAGIAYAGHNSVMARVSFSPNVAAWPLSDAKRYQSIAMLDGRPDMNIPDIDNEYEDDEPEYEQSFDKEKKLGLSHIFITQKTASADITLNDYYTTPHQVGEASRYIANIAGQTPEQIIFHLRHLGMRGRDIVLNRADLERAFLKHHGSSEEIWRTTQFFPDDGRFSLPRLIGDVQTAQRVLGFKIDMVNDVSLSEEDSGLMYRSGIIASTQKFFARHFFSMQSVRFNLTDNLQKLNEYRGISLFPVRGDIDAFTRHGAMMDRAFMTGFVTLGEDVHLASSIGYLEEMYGGAIGEILYRPFDKNWALGLEADLALKRDPYSPSALAPNGDHILSGFLNGYYEVPATGITIKTSVGRYLAGDIGGSFSLKNEFENGVVIAGDITATNKTDRDIYGGKTNFYTGIHLSLPLGSLAFLPNGSRIITNAAPLGRDTAQRLDNPVPLYDLTEPLSYRHITRQWSQLMPVHP